MCTWRIYIIILSASLFLFSCSWKKIDIQLADPELEYSFSIISPDFAYCLSKTDNNNYIVKYNNKYAKNIPLTSSTGIHFTRELQKLLDKGEYTKKIKWHPVMYRSVGIELYETTMLFITPQKKHHIYTWYVRAPQVDAKVGAIFRDLRETFETIFKEEIRRRDIKQ